MAEISKLAWGKVDKSTLPDSAFLWPDKRKYPYREPDTGSGKDDKGRYKKAGPVNYWGLVAAYAAMNGARQPGGKPPKIPTDVKTRANKIFKKYKIGKYRKKSAKEQMALEIYIPGELPGSYEETIAKVRTALRTKFGGENKWVSPIATFDEAVVFSVEEDTTKSTTTRRYLATFTMEDGEVVFGDVKEVEFQVMVMVPKQTGVVVEQGRRNSKSDESMLLEVIGRLGGIVGYDKAMEECRKRMKTKSTKKL